MKASHALEYGVWAHNGSLPTYVMEDNCNIILEIVGQYG